jgi:hypothetical protein
MFVSSKTSSVEALILNVMVFGNGLFGKKLGLDELITNSLSLSLSLSLSHP